MSDLARLKTQQFLLQFSHIPWDSLPKLFQMVEATSAFRKTAGVTSELLKFN